MQKEEFERRAAAMRERSRAPKQLPKDDSQGESKRSNSRAAAERPPVAPVLVVPGLPILPPHALLGGAWKSSHTKLLLAALGDVHALVVRTARSLGSQQVRFDGLVHLGDNGALDIAASTTVLPQALRVFDLLIRRVEEQGGRVSASGGTSVTLDEEVIEIRLREGVDRRPKSSSSSYRENEYFPTGQLWLMTPGEYANKLKTPARDLHDTHLELRAQATE
jgi:hypothetical protein